MIKEKKYRIAFWFVLIIFIVYFICELPYQNTKKFLFPIKGGEGVVSKMQREEGVKIPAVAGEAVRASRSGWVIKVVPESVNSRGKIEIFHPYTNFLFLRSRDGILTIYDNVSDVRVHEGSRVKQGQVIAKVPALRDEAGEMQPSYLLFQIQK